MNEEVRFIGPSGRTVCRWGPQARHMGASMDLTVEVDRSRGRRLRRIGHVRRLVHHRRRDRRRDRGPGPTSSSAGEAPQGGRGGLEEVRRDLGRRRGERQRQAAPCGSPTGTGGSTCCRSASRAPRSRRSPGVPSAPECCDHAPQAPRHRAGRVPGPVRHARGRRVGGGREGARRPAAQPRRTAGRLARRDGGTAATSRS